MYPGVKHRIHLYVFFWTTISFLKLQSCFSFSFKIIQRNFFQTSKTRPCTTPPYCNIISSKNPTQRSAFVNIPHNHYFSTYSQRKIKSHSSLFMTTNSNDINKNSKQKSQVILQKVIRSIPIPILIEYLRDIYQIPSSQLSMPYEVISNIHSHPMIQKQNQNSDGKGGTIVTAFQSPMAGSDEVNDTLLWVEVLGVFVGKKSEAPNQIATPQMAMVAIKKLKPSSDDAGSGVMMTGLYEDSQKKIIASLEQGLDDLAEGKGSYFQKLQKDNEELNKEEKSSKDSKLEDSDETKVSDTKSPEIVTSSNKVDPTDNTYDPSKVANPFEDFLSLNHDLNMDNNLSKNPHREEQSPSEDNIIDAVIDVTAKGSASNVNIEDEDKNINRKTESEVTEEERQKELDSITKSSSSSVDADDIDLNNPENKDALEEELSAFMEQGEDVSPEELLQNVLDFGIQSEKEEQTGTGFVAGAFEKAKELLRDGRKSKPQHQPFSPTKFKDKEDSMQGQISDFMNIPDEPTNEINQQSEGIDEQEELRRFFAAGERAAEGRIVQNMDAVEEDLNSLSTASKIPDEEIDRLIEADKTVPRPPKNQDMDDELAELEIRINRNPGEDGPAGPVFDILSGPPSASSSFSGMDLGEDDPTMANNFPGAPYDPNKIRADLPKDLKEAVQYAKFASDTLSKISQDEYDESKFYLNNKVISASKVAMLEKCVDEAVQAGFIDIHPLDEMAERARLTLLVDELAAQPDEDRFDDIVEGYKDLLLSDRFVELVKERLVRMANREKVRRENGVEEGSIDDQKDVVERDHLSKLTRIAMLLLKETRAMGAELEASQLEIIRSICQVAMDPKHTTEEEAAVALTETVKKMRPILDDSFVAYLKYAIAEEEGRLARRKLLDDPEHNTWLFVLQIVQEGVYAELGREVSRYIDHIEYVLRMESKKERKELLIKLVDVMPSMDVRPFIKIVDNIVASLGTSAKGEFSDASVLGGMTREILQLSSDLKEVLPPERVDRMSRDADEWTARQRKKIQEQRDLTRQRLVAKRQQQALIEGTTDSSNGLLGSSNLEKLP